MAGAITQVAIPFRPLLLQITDCLNFHPPKYTLLDEARNNVVLSISERSCSATHVYVGGPAPNVGDSCENAARQAVRSLMDKFNVIVQDITSTRQAVFEKCTALYKLKYTELAFLEKGLGKTTLNANHGRPALRGYKIVTLDYMSVLRSICQKLQFECVAVDTVEHDPSHFTSFALIDKPGTPQNGKCIVGECCSDIVKARNSLAEKAIQFLAAAYNLEIVDANYRSRPAILAPVACALQRESFRTIRERVLGIKEDVDASCFLVEGDCITPRGEGSQIPTLNGPPLPPRKRRCPGFARSGSEVPGSRNYVPVFFKVPEPLETVFSLPKTGQ